MGTVKIEILNPKAKKLLRNLEELNLIVIRDYSESGFSELLKKLRSKSPDAPTLEEITKEVELVRSERYGKKDTKTDS